MYRMNFSPQIPVKKRYHFWICKLDIRYSPMKMSDGLRFYRLYRLHGWSNFTHNATEIIELISLHPHPHPTPGQNARHFSFSNAIL